MPKIDTFLKNYKEISKRESELFKFSKKACFVLKLLQFKYFVRYSMETGTRKSMMSHSSQGNADNIYSPKLLKLLLNFLDISYGSVVLTAR